MEIFKSIPEIQVYLETFRKKHQIIGFVPTMGALHKGHLSLIKKAKENCDIVVSSIFVNPTQFNNSEDLKNYPRHLGDDIKMLESENCDVLFAPEISEIYTTQELDLKNRNIEDKTWTAGIIINFGNLEKVMEGEFRPGHFNGVAQVVTKLFNIVKPNRAYFGQKDFQQLAIIKSLVRQMNFPIEIVSCEIVREDNGLAMSSRNERLTPEEREIASVISKTLFEIKKLKNTHSVGELKTFALEFIKQEPKIKLEYFEIADVDTLIPLSTNTKVNKAIACIAVTIGKVRLIDNILLDK